jgi:hypothetical protein
MGRVAESIMAYAQPLIDSTDGSLEEVNKALSLSALCYNLALTPEEDRVKSLDKLRRSMNLSDVEFIDLCRDCIIPMIQRHQEMFPGLHHRRLNSLAQRASVSRLSSRSASRNALTEGAPVPVDRYAPCSCNSGRKYKFCCGRSPR